MPLLVSDTVVLAIVGVVSEELAFILKSPTMVTLETHGTLRAAVLSVAFPHPGVVEFVQSILLSTQFTLALSLHGIVAEVPVMHMIVPFDMHTGEVLGMQRSPTF